MFAILGSLALFALILVLPSLHRNVKAILAANPAKLQCSSQHFPIVFRTVLSSVCTRRKRRKVSDEKICYRRGTTKKGRRKSTESESKIDDEEKKEVERKGKAESKGKGRRREREEKLPHSLYNENRERNECIARLVEILSFSIFLGFLTNSLKVWGH